MLCCFMHYLMYLFHFFTCRLIFKSFSTNRGITLSGQVSLNLAKRIQIIPEKKILKMDGDNNAPSGSGQQNQGPNNNRPNQSPAPFRVRRPSASIISSTTPMFQAPQNPNLQPPPRRNHNHNVIQNHNFGPGDIDDDVQPQSSTSSLSSLRHRLSAGVGSSNSNNNRPQSPLGSPDSTYWGASPSPAAHHSYRAPSTPGGMCVVSSSTSDDIPQSPFSQDEDAGGNSNHSFPVPSPAAPMAQLPVVDNRSLAPLPDHGGEYSNQNINIGAQLPRRRPSLAVPSSSSSTPTLNLSFSSSILSNRITRGGKSSGSILNSQLQNGNLNQDLNQNPGQGSSSAATNSNASSSSSTTGSLSSSSSTSSSALHAQQSFNISPLRNKIKKASSFERFSLAQAAIISNNNSAASSSLQNQNASNGNEQLISSIPPTSNSNSIETANSSSNNNAVNVSGGPARTIWEATPPPHPDPTPSTSTSALRSFSSHGLADKFHIKIPNKKLAAKFASEQEKLNEQLNATLAAAEAISNVGSTPKRLGLSSVISSVAGTSNQSHNESLLNSQTVQSGQNPPSTLAQILNQTSSMHVNMTDESIVNQGEVSHENLIREFSEAPLNLTDNNAGSSSTSQNHSQQQAALLPPRNPVISSSSRGTLLSHSKKIPLTPKQKLLHRLQSGELMPSLSPPPQPIVSLSQQLSQQQQPLQVQTIQQQSVSTPVVTLHQSSLPMNSEPLQNQSTSGGVNVNHVTISSNNSSHSPPQQQQQQQQPLDQYSYEALLRSRDDFVGQDTLGKVGEDPNVVSNMLSVYDPEGYYYSYQNILGDEIFTGNNSSVSSRQLLMMQSGNLPDSMDQPQGGPLEFVLGFSGSVDDHDDRGRDDDLQLNNMDPNDALSAMKSQNQADSTLRNLLMMDPISRNSHNDDASWLLAEYQNRINADSISRSGSNMRSNSGLVSAGGNMGASGSSVVSMSNINNSAMNNNSNSWVNEWPRTSSWQSHPSSGCGMGVGVQDQDEVMDMVIFINKT